MTSDDWNSLGVTSANLTEFYSVSKEDAEEIDNVVWGDQSYDIGTTTAYDGVTQNEKVPQDYIDKNIPIIEKRIVIGGLRLSSLIQDIFGSQTQTKEVFLN